MNYRRCFVYLMVCACEFAPAAVCAQVRATPEPTVIEQPLMAFFANPMFQVAEAASADKVRFEFRPDFRKLIGALSFVEGHYLVMSRTPTGQGPVRLFPAQVTDVAAGGVLTLTVGPTAAKQIRQGDFASLFRPIQSTTALMRSLPELIPVQNGDSKSPVAAVADELLAERMAATRSRSINNLKQIGLAMHNFEAANGQFPPAVIFGPDGKPWHSWRVLILPYLEGGQDLFNAYDFNQPWDSEKNRKLLDHWPSVYHDTVYGDTTGHFTHYAALVGPNTAFTPEGGKMTGPNTVRMDQGGRRIANFTDGTSFSLLIVPVANDRKIPWTKPEDITVGPNFPGIGTDGGIAAPYKAGPQADGPRIAPVLFADGSVHSFPDTMPPKVLSAFTTINGGEIIPPTAFSPDRGAAPQPKLPILKIRIENGKASAVIE